MKSTRLAIFGVSGHAAVVADAARATGMFDVVGYIGATQQAGELAPGGPVLGCDADLQRIVEANGVDAVIVAIGDNAVRRRVAESVRSSHPGLSFATVVHPSAVVADSVSIGSNTFIAAGAIIGPRTKIGIDCIVNTGAKLDHDCTLEAFASLAPGVVTGGRCRIGNGAAVSIGAVVIHGISIGADTVIGAGSVVLKDVPDRVVAYGHPARIIRNRERGERYL